VKKEFRIRLWGKRQGAAEEDTQSGGPRPAHKQQKRRHDRPGGAEAHSQYQVAQIRDGNCEGTADLKIRK